MLRGSVIVITALLKRFVLGHVLRVHMWSGIAVIATAMVVVASVSLFEASDDDSTSSSSSTTTVTSSDAKLGVILVLTGCLAQGVQYVFEEKVMATDPDDPGYIYYFIYIYIYIYIVFFFLVLITI